MKKKDLSSQNSLHEACQCIDKNKKDTILMVSTCDITGPMRLIVTLCYKKGLLYPLSRGTTNSVCQSVCVCLSVCTCTFVCCLCTCVYVCV